MDDGSLGSREAEGEGGERFTCNLRGEGEGGVGAKIELHRSSTGLWTSTWVELSVDPVGPRRDLGHLVRY